MQKLRTLHKEIKLRRTVEEMVQRGDCVREEMYLLI